MQTLTWNEFVKYVNSKLTKKQKNYEIDYIDFSTIYDELDIITDDKNKILAIND